VIPHDAVRDGQSEPCSFGLGRVEGVEDPGQNIRRDPGPVIAHGQPGHAGAPRNEARLQGDDAAAAEGVARIGHEVHHDLLERIAVAMDQGKARRQRPPNRDSALVSPFLHEQERLLHHLIEIDGPSLTRRLAREGQQPMRDARHPLRMTMQHPQVLRHIARQGLDLRVEQHDLDARGDDSDRVVDLVRDPR
jgi:hypothetical protein